MRAAVLDLLVHGLDVLLQLMFEREAAVALGAVERLAAGLGVEPAGVAGQVERGGELLLALPAPELGRAVAVAVLTQRARLFKCLAARLTNELLQVGVGHRVPRQVTPGQERSGTEITGKLLVLQAQCGVFKFLM